MAKKFRKIWNSRAEWEAHNARIDRDIRRMRALAEKAWAELVEKKPELKNL